MARDRRTTPGRRTTDGDVRSALQEAFIALTDGVVIVDGGGTVRSANPAAFRLLGEDELIGRAFSDLLLVHGAATVSRSEGHSVRRSWFPREERMGVLEIVSTALRDGTIHTIRDVTAQAELLRLKEDFLMQVAHELRTPIAALVASLDLVHQDALSMPREELSLMVNTLRRSALRLEHLVENLLDAGSIEAGTFQVRTIPTSLRRALDESLTLVQPLCDAKGQSIDTALARGSDRVVADPRRTTQVFANLIANASKYSPESTTITVAAVDADGFVRATVSDEGPGIGAEDLPRVFDRFYRTRESREAAGGLGLGLAICRAIVHAQGGEISVESPEGGGTAVHFTVPKARELPEEADRT